MEITTGKSPEIIGQGILIALSGIFSMGRIASRTKKYLNNQYFGLYKPIKWLDMITKKQLDIFEVFARNPLLEYTRKQVKSCSKEKSNNLLAITINMLKKEGVLTEKKVGKSGLLTLNLENDTTLYYIALSNANRINSNVENAVLTLKKAVGEITPFYSLAIFGSYASNEQKKGSDLDIAVFIERADNKKQIIASLNSARLRINLETDIHVITRPEMIEMLTNSEENLGKQIARKHLALNNHQLFYGLILEGMRHGFRA